MEFVRVRLIERIRRSPSIESFRFTPEKKIHFIPGQFLQVIFDEQDQNNRELNKYLSFSASPTKDYIEITKRISESAFSRTLTSLVPGRMILVKAPMGSCTFDDSYKKIAFLIGGIGITPVISIVEYIVGRNLPTDVLLVYSNRSPEEIAFKDKLDVWFNASNRMKLIYTITDAEPTLPPYVSGRITPQLLLETSRDWDQRIVFSFGPPKMVAAMQEACRVAGCPREYVKTENFIGY